MKKGLVALFAGASGLVLTGGLLSTRIQEAQNSKNIAPIQETYVVPGAGTELDLDSFPITTPRATQNLVDTLADSGVSDKAERLKQVKETNLRYDVPNGKNRPDIKFSTTVYTSPVLQIFDNVSLGPIKRYGKTLETIGETQLYIIDKPFELASISDIKEAERNNKGLQAIPMDYTASKATEFELSKFNKLWTAYRDADAEEGQLEALTNMRGLENIFNNAPIGTVVGITTQDKTNGKGYYIIKITSEEPLGRITRDLYIPNWNTGISVRRLYDNNNN